MSQMIKNDQWIWAVIQDPEGDAQLLGQQDEEDNISFIPVFLEKDEALMCMNLLVREEARKYEVQAILYEDLLARIEGKGFMIFILDGSGKVIERIGEP
ncbi:MAG: hypothetical protein GY864_07625 [Desulfobacterales bacterium]|nr:hypothetical protein [Desulfobacterales bacterium]